MFNGIIFYQGKVKKIVKRRNGINLFLYSQINLSKKDLGSSISCDGVCLTLTSCEQNTYEFYLSSETLLKSKFKKIKVGDKINIELSLKYGQRISGHICQGHVDTVGKVVSIKKSDKSKIYEFKLDKKFLKYLVGKASIAINGVSLTISKITSKGFQVWTIPHTLKLTNLSNIRKKSVVNIEFDILSKYIKNYIS